MNRRKFLKSTIGTTVAISAVGAGVWFSIDKNTKPLTIDSALLVLKSLSETPLKSLGKWNPTQIFNHCAQSVEFSMSGFPEHKSEVFKNIVGQIAFSAFSAKGKMTHSLNEVIPGAPVLRLENNLEKAIERLKESMLSFQSYNGKLQPHFAYGELSKSEYEAAHVMHLYNHLKEIAAA